MHDYQREARELDDEVLEVIRAWHDEGRSLDDAAFNALALRIFTHQLRYNGPYARYCERLGVTLKALPQTWERIPAVPAAAFKEASLTTFDPNRAALRFETSGTTVGTPGRHYMETRELYDAALLAGFDRFVLADGARLRYFNLVPNPVERPQSSLGYMMDRVGRERGWQDAGWYVDGEELRFTAFLSDISGALERGQAVCIAATAFSLLHVLDALEREHVKLQLPPGSRLMETGGFKGRAREISRDELYTRTTERLGLPPERIVGEYGMTELTSQYYDVNASARAKASPPWLRPRVVAPDRTTRPFGEIGSLLHVDLANRSSCIAVQTEDFGYRTDCGIVLLGRNAGSEARGCSLDAETLHARNAKRLVWDRAG